MELSSLAGADVAGDLMGSLGAVSDRLPETEELHRKLAVEYGVYILAASGPVVTDAATVNRARFFSPSGAMGQQDKQIMTRFEREDFPVQGGGPLAIFDTSVGKVGILICYDCEFPLLGRALADCDLILVPSNTEALSGYWRVRIGAMARALENQCVTVMSSCVGEAAWSAGFNLNTGAGGVFGPPDKGFPATGVLAEGALNAPGWAYAEVDPAAIAHVRQDGVVMGRSHWPEQHGRDGVPNLVDFR
jgi:predicted amidohydrolase